MPWRWLQTIRPNHKLFLVGGLMGAVVISPLIHWGGMIRSQPRDRPSNALLSNDHLDRRGLHARRVLGSSWRFQRIFLFIALSVKDPIGRHCMGGVSVFLDVFGRRIGGCASRYQSTYGLGGMHFLCIQRWLMSLTASERVLQLGGWDEWMEKYLGLGSGQYKYTIPCTDAYKI
jgi:hypothetical protein